MRGLVSLVLLGLLAVVPAGAQDLEEQASEQESTSPASGRGRIFVHVVRPGETLASIAQRYYGDTQRENVLVAENGLTAQGGAAIVVGLRLAIPHVAYHRVREGETWNELATQYYGDPKRAFILIEANDSSAGEAPDEGAEVIVPYPLRHVAGQGASLVRLAKEYYGDGDYAKRLRRFNNIRGNRVTRGRIVLVPLMDLELSEEGRKSIAEGTGRKPSGGQVREQQQRIDEKLPELRERAREGRFTELVALGNQLLGAEQLTGNQVVTIQRQLAVAYVALGRDDLAVRAFTSALARQPDLELDAMRTSPTVMRAFRLAKSQQAERAKAEAQAEAEDEADDESSAEDAGAPE